MIPFLIEDLRQDEGLELVAYPDPDSPLGAEMRKARVALRNWRSFPNPRFLDAEPWTCGYGATGEDIGPDTAWTHPQAEADLAKRCQQVETQLDFSLSWWRKLDPVRQAVIANMAYNLGLGRLLKFKHMLTAAEAGDWLRASSEMLLSAWASQVHDRATRLASQMRTGVR